MRVLNLVAQGQNLARVCPFTPSCVALILRHTLHELLPSHIPELDKHTLLLTRHTLLILRRTLMLDIHTLMFPGRTSLLPGYTITKWRAGQNRPPRGPK